MIAFVADGRWRSVELLESAQPRGAADPGGSGDAHADVLGNLPDRQPLPPQRDDADAC